MIVISKKELTVLEKIQLLTRKKIIEYKTSCEANIVSMIYKKPELLSDCDLDLSDFNVNCWRVFFEAARLICDKEEKKSLDEVTIGLFLEKHPKLKEQYENYGGYAMINDSFQYTKLENFHGYVRELIKWKSLLKLNERGFPLYDRLSDFTDMTIEEIYEEFEALLNDTFINLDTEYSSHDISDNIFQLIDDLDNGIAVGLPYHNMPILTSETSGQALGFVTLIGGLSNVGKSTFLRNAIIPSTIENKEKIVIMLNEEDYTKWQRELMVYVANNILHKELKKMTVRNGSFEVDKKKILVEAANWIVENTKNHMITVVCFTQYKTSRVLKIIRKYSALGVKYFALDTFKLDAGKVSDSSWLAMQQSMVDIKDLVKKENKNVHISITFQLSKGSTRQRFYMQDNIGLSKNIVDPSDTVIMLRKLFEDEKSGEKKELDVRDKDNKKVFLEPEKNYQILFLIKNREGSANSYQIVIEHNLSKNILKEVGICHVPMDF